MIDANWLSAAYNRDTDLECSVCKLKKKGRISTLNAVRTVYGEINDDSFCITKTQSKVLCGKCWKKLYVVCRADANIYLRRNCKEIVDHGMVPDKYVAHQVCPISGVTYMCSRDISWHNDYLYVVKSADAISKAASKSGADPSQLIYDMPDKVLMRYTGLTCVVDGDVPMSAGELSKEMVYVSADGRLWVVLNNNRRYLAAKVDTIPLDYGGGYIHKLEAHHYEHTCPMTKKKFYSAGNERYSKQGIEDIKKLGLLVCRSSGCIVNKDEAIVDSDGRIVSPRHSHLPAFYYDGSDFRHVNGESGRSIGIELELEVPIDAQMAVWKTRGLRPNKTRGSDMLGQRSEFELPPVSAHQDGSLRGPHPIEYVSPILYESNYVEWLDMMCKALRGSKVYSRAGFHLHLSSKDMSYMDLMRLGAFAQYNQEWFYSIVAPSRMNNTFVGQLPDFVGAMPHIKTKAEYMTWMYGKPNIGSDGAHNKRANDMGNSSFRAGVIHRYQWINFHSHVFRRTLEIRLHHATSNKTKIENWTRLWLTVFNHISNGGNWHIHPMDILSDDLRSYYSERKTKFDIMRAESGVEHALEPPNIGLLRSPETFRQIADGIAGAAAPIVILGWRDDHYNSVRQIINNIGTCRLLAPDFRVLDSIVASIRNWGSCNVVIKPLVTAMWSIQIDRKYRPSVNRQYATISISPRMGEQPVPWSDFTHTQDYLMMRGS